MPTPDLLVNSNIRNRLASVSLPTVPLVLVKLMELSQSAESSLTELGNLIACDVALTAKILRRASSSLYKSNKQADLMQSIQILGMDMIKLICISESVCQVFGDFKHINDSVFQKLWIHSLLTAVAARLIAKGMNYPNIEEAYLAGLLHDVGRLALLSAEPSVSEFLSKDDEALCKLERQLFMFTHAEAGAWIIEQWNFDSILADSILYHHEEAERIANTHPLIRVVSLAEILAQHLKEKSPIPLDLISVLSGSAVFNVDEVIRNTAKQVKEAFAALGIDNDEIMPAKLSAPEDGAPSVTRRKKDMAQLSNRLRNHVLITESDIFISRQNADSAIYQALLQLTCWIFNFNDAMIFFADESESILKAMPSDEHRQYLADFFIPLNDRPNAASEALLNNRPTFISHEDTQLEVIEEQLQRILGGSCLVCLPLSGENMKKAVLIGCVDSGRLTHIHMRSRFLQQYGDEMSRVIGTLTIEGDRFGRRTISVGNELQEKIRRILHEINNPLTIIKNYLNVLKGKADENKFMGDELLILNEEIDRVSELINSLNKPVAESSSQITEINKTVNEMTGLFRGSGFVPSTVEIIVHTSEQSLELDCSQHIFKQILMNLLKNSVEALPDGGKIEISCKDFINLDGQKYIGLIISDTGPGIDNKMMNKMFSSIQSTKDEKYRGLGLSIVYDLISEAKGHISCRSGESGATFEVLFPIHTPESK
jgi:putative nucleotidyltransferase with HDIG domain